tara:strand:- start:168 stop:473 length:306 start_codon:yes stop_codon:yes gene_type:complete
MSDFWHGLVNYKPKKTMKAKIEIELGNSAFGNNQAERLFEMRNVIERLMDNADRIMAADVGDFTTAQDGNGNTVARMDIVEGGRVPEMYGLKNQAPDKQLK